MNGFSFKENDVYLNEKIWINAKLLQPFHAYLYNFRVAMVSDCNDMLWNSNAELWNFYVMLWEIKMKGLMIWYSMLQCYCIL